MRRSVTGPKNPGALEATSALRMRSGSSPLWEASIRSTAWSYSRLIRELKMRLLLASSWSGSMESTFSSASFKVATAFSLWAESGLACGGRSVRRNTVWGINLGLRLTPMPMGQSRIRRLRSLTITPESGLSVQRGLAPPGTRHTLTVNRPRKSRGWLLIRRVPVPAPEIVKPRPEQGHHEEDRAPLRENRNRCRDFSDSKSRTGPPGRVAVPPSVVTLMSTTPGFVISHLHCHPLRNSPLAVLPMPASRSEWSVWSEHS